MVTTPQARPGTHRHAQARTGTHRHARPHHAPPNPHGYGSPSRGVRIAARQISVGWPRSRASTVGVGRFKVRDTLLLAHFSPYIPDPVLHNHPSGHHQSWYSVQPDPCARKHDHGTIIYPRAGVGVAALSLTPPNPPHKIRRTVDPPSTPKPTRHRPRARPRDPAGQATPSIHW